MKTNLLCGPMDYTKSQFNQREKESYTSSREEEETWLLICARVAQK